MTRIVRRSAAAIAFCLATLAAGSAEASDYGEPAAYPLAFDWTGFYLGAHGGMAFGKSDHSNEDLSFDLDGNAAVAGGLIGFNLQYGYLVYGLEGDFSYGEIDSDDTVGPGPFVPANPVPVSFDLHPAATIRGRIGFALDTWMVYVTGGLAVAHGHLEFETSNPDNADSNLHLGYVFGGGVEYAVTDWMTLRAEYLCSRYNEEDYRINTDNTVPADPEYSTFETDFDVHTLRAGVTFNFSRLF